MNNSRNPGLTASLTALIMALILAWLVLRLEWTPEHAATIIIGTTLIFGLGILLVAWAMARTPDDRALLWREIRDTVNSDLQPVRELWHLIRRRHK